MNSGVKCFIIAILIVSNSIIIPSTFGQEFKPKIKENKPIINVAIILQKWDYLDLLVLTYIVPFYIMRMAQIQLRYKVDTNLKVFWDGLDGGDVQSGKLFSEDIDIAIGPGGMGSFYTPEPYREQLISFIENGGGFFAICGDCYYGTQGFINESEKFEEIIFKLFKFDKVSPPLNLAPVICDIKPFTEAFPNESTENNIFFMALLFKLIFANSIVKISDSDIPFAEKLQGKYLFVETGLFPLYLNNSEENENISIIATYVKSRTPFNDSLIDGTISMLATEYKNGRVIISPMHTEVSFLRFRAHEIFFDAILWLAKLK